MTELKGFPDELSRRLWEEHWHLLAHRTEVANARDYARFQAGGAEAVVYHDGDQVVAFDNRCPHRGARIFDGDHGNERFACRYHGWSYAKGKVFVAGKEQFAHCPLQELSLNKLSLEWLGDFAFVSASPRMALRDQLGEVAPVIESISYSIASRHDFNSYLYEADWRIALENALEPYHVGGIHPTTLNTLKLTPGRNDYVGGNSIWYSEVGEARTAKRLASLTRMFDLQYQFEGYFSVYLFPFTMISSTFGFSYSMQHFLPATAPERTHFTSRLFTSRLKPSTKPELLASFFESSAQLNRSVFEEDHEICKRVPLDSWSAAPPRFWSANEEKIIHFRHAYDAFARGAEPEGRWSPQPFFKSLAGAE